MTAHITKTLVLSAVVLGIICWMPTASVHTHSGFSWGAGREPKPVPATQELPQNPAATPLIDFTPGQLYLNTFTGNLYENSSNNPPSDHQAAGLTAAAQVRPINGKFAVVMAGMSNWLYETCTHGRGAGLHTTCEPGSFINQALQNSKVNQSTMVLISCAIGSATAKEWVNDNTRKAPYTNCKQKLAQQGLTEQQVEVIMWKNADGFPTVSLSPGTVCTPTVLADACQNENLTGQVVRYMKTRYPNLKMIFFHSRIYAGYAQPRTLNPEPYAYENGLAVKWLIQAQIDQERGGNIDPNVGDVKYSDGSAPLMLWGPYFWAAGSKPNSQGTFWLTTDYRTDFTHPNANGDMKVGTIMLKYYLASPFSPCFSPNPDDVVDLQRPQEFRGNPDFEYVQLDLPHPPPPGVRIVSTVDGGACKLHFDRKQRLRLCVAIRISPAFPGEPPARP